MMPSYLVHRSKRNCRVATISLDLSAIVHHHKAHGFADPTAHPSVGRTWLGIRKKLGTAQAQKAPATTEVVRTMLGGLPEGLLGVRDRALLTLGFAGGFRRSELVGLDLAHLRFVRGAGLEATVVRSKTDQTGAGFVKEIAYGSDPDTCPVRAVKEWLKLAAIQEGAVFRSVNRHGQVSSARLSAQTVRLIVKRALDAAGVSSDAYSAHSLRAGLVTSAKERGIDDAAIMKVTGHRSLQTMHNYDRRAKRWKDPASGKLGL
jgi:integrase